MRAIHCLWTKPYHSFRNTAYLSFRDESVGESIDSFILPDHSLLTLLLSAGMWRKHHGPIKLYTDSVFAEILKKLGIEDLYDEVECCFDSIDANAMLAEVFWSCARFEAYRRERERFVYLDTDFIVWKKINFSLYEDCDLVCTHSEDVTGERYYGPKENLSRPAAYSFSDQWDWKAPALNSSFVYMNNSMLKDRIVIEAEKFMAGNLVVDRTFPTKEVLFVELRLPAMIAKEMGMTTRTLIDATWKAEQDHFITHDPHLGVWDCTRRSSIPYTHLWVGKEVLRKYRWANDVVCFELAKGMKVELPELAARCKAIERVQQYF